MNTYTIKISTAFWCDHEERLWESEDGFTFTHVDGEMVCRVIASNKKQTTIEMCFEGVKELYSDASYQCEVSLEDSDMRAYATCAGRVMVAIRKQVELPAKFLQCWEV